MLKKQVFQRKNKYLSMVFGNYVNFMVNKHFKVVDVLVLVIHYVKC